MTHLDAARWQALQTQRDPVLLAHLEAGCDDCDAFLAALPGPGGEFDRLLLALAPRPGSTDELAWARFRRRQRAPRRLAFVAAAAAVVVVVAGAWAAFLPAEQPFTGLKGSGRAQLELRAAFKSPAGALTPVPEGASLPSSAALVFQVRSGLAGPARLYVQRGGAEPVELAQLGLVEGAQELEVGEAPDGKHELLGFSLKGERGPVLLWLVAAEQPISSEAALMAIRAGGAEGVWVAHVRVDVVEVSADTP